MIKGRIRLLRASDVYNNCSTMRMLLENRNALNAVNAIEIEKLEFILSVSTLSNETKRELIETEKTVVVLNSIELDRIKLIFRISNTFTGFMIKRLLQNGNAVKAINLIDFEKLKLLISHGKFHSYKTVLKSASDWKFHSHNSVHEYALAIFQDELEELYKISCQDITTFKHLCNSEDKMDHFITSLLGNQNAVDGMNGIDIERLDLLINSNENINSVVNWLVKTEYALDAINAINIEKFKILLNTKELYNDYIMMKILKDQNTVDEINSLDTERLIILLNNGKFDGISLASILGDSQKVHAIRDINTCSVKDLLQNGQLIMNLRGKKNDKDVKGIDLLFNNDEYYYPTKRMLARHQCTVGEIDSMHVDKLTLFIESCLFDFSSLMLLFKSRSTVDSINKVQTDRIEFLLNIGRAKGLATPRMLVNRSKNELPNLVSNEVYAIILREVDGNFLIEMLMDSSVLCAISSINIENLKLISSSTAVSRSLLKEILRDKIISDLLTSIDVEKLKVLLDKFSLDDFVSFVRDPSFAEGIKLIEPEKLSLLFNSYNNILQDELIVNLLKHEDALNLIISTDDQTLLSLLEKNDLSLYVFRKLIIEDIKDDLIDKVNILFDNDSYREDTLDKLLKDRHAFDMFEALDIEKFQMLIRNHKLDYYAIARKLKNRRVITAINNIPLPTLQEMCLLLDASTLSRVLGSPAALSGIGNLNMKRIRFLLTNYSLYDNHDLKKLLEDNNAIALIRKIDYEFFKSVLKNGGLYDPLFTKVVRTNGFDYGKKLDLLYSDSDRRERTRVGIIYRDLNYLNLIDMEKLRILLCLHDDDLFSLLGNRRIVNLINDLDYGKFLIWITYDWSPMQTLDLMLQVDDSSTIINSIDDEKFKYFTESYFLVFIFLNRISEDTIRKLDLTKFTILSSLSIHLKVLLNDTNIVNAISSFDNERLKLLVDSEKETFRSGGELETLAEILKSDVICNAIHSLDIEKLQLLAEARNGVKLLTLIPTHEKVLDFINVNSNKKLKLAISNTNVHDLHKISMCFEGKIIRNFNFALLLLQYKHINNISWTFVNDDKAVKDTFKKVFPPNFPIDQMLIKSYFDDEGLIPSLKDTSIVAWIKYSSGLINHSDYENTNLPYLHIELVD